MPIYQEPQLMAYIDSAITSVVTAVTDTYYVVDTAMTAVSVTLPPGIPVGQVITIQNAPNNGPQMGGTVPGGNVTILTTSPEVFDDGTTSQVLGPPTSMITAACRTYYPTGGVAQAGFAGWAH
jgi:hypothetical protein